MSRYYRDTSRKKCDMNGVHTAYESIRVIDSFMPPGGAEALREIGLDANFLEIEYDDDRFPSISVCGDEVSSMMEPALRLATGHDVEILHSFYKMSGELVHAGDNHDFAVHWDEEVAPYTAVLHLNQAPYAVGGTGFWRHVPTGWTSVKELSAHGATMEQLRSDSTESLAWELHTLVGSQWNRLSIYRSDLIHSQWPLRGYGSTKETSRLSWVCFFIMP